MLGLLILALFVVVFVVVPLYFIFIGVASFLLPVGPHGGPDRTEDGGDQ